jgi:peptidoglycan/LPS O-acetylase OafA/YrhL
MDVYVFIMIVIISAVAFYSIHLYLPEKKQYKYALCLMFILFGVIAWLYVWFGNGWLTSAVYGTMSLALGLILLIVAFFFDLLEKRNHNNS